MQPLPTPSPPDTDLQAAVPQAPPPRFRSQAVARRVDMPVGTLRVWERRYGLGCAARTASGHRLYTEADVQRIALMKQLTGCGHAIGTLVGLTLAQLLSLQGGAVSTRGGGLSGRRPWRLVVVGAALAQRLRRLALPGGGELRGPFASVAQAAEASLAPGADPDWRADWLLVDSPLLPPEPEAALAAAAQGWQAARTGLVYGFGHPVAQQAHAGAGLALWRTGGDDAALAQWLTAGQDAGRNADPSPPPDARPGSAADVAALPPARFDDAALAALCAQPARLSCECPRHVAELLMQLTHFEAYSAQCAHRDPQDAALHRQLGRHAGQARLALEAALQALMDQDGLLLALPAPPPQR